MRPIAGALVALALAAPAVAQETYVPARGAAPPRAHGDAPVPPDAARPISPVPGVAAGPAQIDPAEPLYGYSLTVVAAPKPRRFNRHDLVTIIIDEASKQQADQTLKTDKKYNNNATLGAIIDPWELLELRLQAGDTTNLKLLDIISNAKFDGKGNYERNDRFSMKIQAEVIDMKPNGVLVLEARKTIDKNGEATTTVLSGACRQEDITANNTVFSGQLANLTLISRSEGQVNRAGQKGIIPRALETIFNF